MDVVDVDVGGAPLLGFFEVVGWGSRVEEAAAVGLHHVFLFVFISFLFVFAQHVVQKIIKLVFFA